MAQLPKYVDFMLPTLKVIRDLAGLRRLKKLAIRFRH
jgi:hypothetical protein